ncbi:hypothetical protein DFP72DRAFT_1119589 [Ephemerocybe angulata]|uniref:Uncharacterized protein n=1 Tax=Ephemerocybe angulata TaxID=980116 RepID=A0A8H6I085_9AGAR|nr:hypothetical protein DFP72DRAFT_1119589 [Tulosesus angulatus]
MYTQADILARSNAVRNAQQAGLCETVQCCVLGAEALPNSLIVSVPIHPGYEAQSRNIDLDIDQYLEHTGPSVGVRSLNRIESNQFIASSKSHVRFAESGNLRDLAIEVGLWQHILVAKSTYDGRVCDVEEKDRSLIEMLVYSFIEDEASYHQFPVIKHPLRPDHIAEKEIRLRIFDALTPFIPKADIPEFFDILDMCDGAVIGSVVRQDRQPTVTRQSALWGEC